MPFIRKANRKLFVGRSNEIATFTTEILRPEEPTFNIISVKGQGGVGKSTLLARFMTEAANPEFRGYCLTAKVDEQQTSPSDIMDILVRQLEKFTQSCTTFTKFKEALAQYRTGLEQLDSEKELPLAIREIESKRFPTFPSLKPPLASSAATSSSKFEETLRGNFLKKQELVTLLLDCPNMANRASRDNLLGGVRKGGLVTNFARNIADNIDVENIVKTLLDYSGALEELLSYIRVKDSGTQAWQALETFQRGLLVDSFPSASPTDWREECYSDLNYGAISFSQSHPLRNSNQQRENLLRRLTQTFVAELNLIVDGKEDQCQQPYRVILLFDTFEQSGVVAAPWLLDYFLPEDIRGNVVLVFAGREALETSIPQEPKRWLPYLQDETTWAFSLDPFSYEETCEFLKERGITDQAHIDNIWKLSTGLPLYLGLLATDAKGEVDPTQSVVDNFLKWIPEEEDEKLKRQLAQEAALLSRPFNREELAAFSYLPEAERDAYFDWLSRLSFVKSNVLDGRYRYHDIARELFSRHLYQSNRELCYKTRHLLAAYYRQKLEKLETEQGKEAIGSNEWLELKLALAQQLFLLPGEVSHLQAIDQIIRAYSKVKKKQEGEIVRVLQEFAEDSIANQANTGVRQLAGQLVTYVEAKSDSEEFTASVNYLFRKIEDNSSASPGLRAEIYRIRGYTYHNVKRYQEALSDFNCAVGLNFGLESAYVGRGITYILLNEYEKAFADLDKAIELDPQYAWAYRKKGETYLLLKEYDKALVDFNKLIELNPQYAWAYGQRGETYRLLKEYDKALTDFGKAIELNPQYAWAYGHRGETYRLLKEYDKALADFNKAIELDPQSAWVYDNRGRTYRLLKEYDKALTDFGKAIELNPQDAWAYGQRGETYRLLKEYDKALVDFNKLIELNPQDAWAYALRGKTYRLLKEYDKALVEFNKAIELDPQYAWAYAQRGITYGEQKEYDKALADFNKAIELDPQYAWAYGNRGRTYLWLNDLDSSKSAYMKALEIEPKSVWYGLILEWITWIEAKPGKEIVERLRAIAAYDPSDHNAAICEGIASWVSGLTENGLVEIERAISMKPDDFDTCFWKGVILATMNGREAEAMAAIALALENDLPPILIGPLRWTKEDAPHFYENHALPLLEKYGLLDKVQTQ